MDNRKIGVFDSGVGGLTVVSEVFRYLPNEEIVYFGDTARVPYGSKSRGTVLKYSAQLMNFMLAKDVKAVIIACGTISSNCREELAAMYDVPIVDVLTPGAEACAAATINNIAGVIGTERTIKSGAFERRLKALKQEITVYSKACPLFVPLAEEGWFDNPVADLAAEIYLRELADKKIDALLIACTHYPLLLNCIKKVTGDIKIINPAEAAAQKMKTLLADKNIFRDSPIEPRHEFYISDDTDKFGFVSRHALQKEYPVIVVDIEKY